MSLTYRLSPIHSAGLEISLHPAFTCCQKESFKKVNGFNNSFYDWDQTVLVDDKKDEENSDTNDENLVINAKDDGRDDMIVLD